MVSKQSTKTFWTSWFLWIFANTTGAGIGLGITLAASTILGFDTDSAISLVLVSATAICIGIAQWLIVRRYATHALLWIVASIFGVFLGAIVIGIVAWIADLTIGAEGMSNLMQGAFSMALPLTLYGTSIGFMQWLFLRKYAIHENTKWWIFASAFGAALLGILIGNSMTNIAEVVLVGTIPAITTGFVWAMSLQRSSIVSSSRA